MTVLIHYMIVYGYPGVFLLVLLMEMGLPGLPNEIVLWYFGYLGKKAGLSFPVLLILGISADILGTCILFSLFSLLRERMNKPLTRWLQKPWKKSASLRNRLSDARASIIFLAKLTPFVRSYLPVAAGLVAVCPARFMRIIAIAATLWTGGIISLGWYFGS
ncbi:MAG TPA: VTT domain-containing protein [Sediminibacterium sp.]|nr:VTT domain-containing protein [Sediminibacterium sp.]